MTRPIPASLTILKTPPHRATVWLLLSIAAAVLAIAGNVIALTNSSIYSHLSPAFLPQALAQDIANVSIISPLWVILAILALRGSFRAYLLWLGVATFTVYNYVIYTFSIPFGPLFPLWVTVFGLSLYSLIGGIAAIEHRVVALSFGNRRSLKVVAWSLIVTATAFGLLWLSEDIPALLAGTSPKSLVALALPTNPVHVLDLGFFLPGVIITGVLLLRRTPLAFSLAPIALFFMLLTGLPILVTPIVEASRGKVPAWGIVLPVAALTVLLLTLLAWLLATMSIDMPLSAKHSANGSA